MVTQLAGDRTRGRKTRDQKVICVRTNLKAIDNAFHYYEADNHGMAISHAFNADGT